MTNKCLPSACISGFVIRHWDFVILPGPALGHALAHSAPRLLAELANRFEGVFDACAAAHNNARLAFHAYPPRPLLAAAAEGRAIQRRPRGEALAVAGADRCGADPFQFAGDGSVALVGKCLKEKADALSGDK